MYNFLMLLGCGCETTAIEKIPANVCKKNMKQRQRDIFANKGEIVWDIATPANNIPTGIVGELIQDVAGWNTLFSATDDTGITITPNFGGNTTVTKGGSVIVGGGDNSTANGEEIFFGSNPNTVNADFIALDAAQVTAIRKLECVNALEVYWVDQDGFVWGWKDGDNVTGIPVTALRLESKENQGYATLDRNMLTYQIPANYDQFLYRFTPSDWNALTINT